jgi:hypothetical protein
MHKMTQNEYLIHEFVTRTGRFSEEAIWLKIMDRRKELSELKFLQSSVKALRARALLEEDIIEAGRLLDKARDRESRMAQILDKVWGPDEVFGEFR